MIRDAIDFFKREKAFTLLSMVVLAAYLWVMIHGKPTEGMQNPQPDAFQRAQQTTPASSSGSGQDVMKDEVAALQKLIKENPRAAGLLTLIVFCVAGFFTVGLIVNLTLVFNPAWRQSWNLGVYDLDKTDWKPSMLFKVVIFFLAASFGLNVFLVALQKFVFPDFSINLILLIQTTIVDFLCLYFMVYVIRQNGGKAKDLGFRVPPRGVFAEMVMGMIGYLGVFPIFVAVLIFLAFIAHLFAYQPPAHPLVNILLEKGEGSRWMIYYSVVLATIIAPFLEEIFFRGFCYTLFKKKAGPGAAMVLSSALFAVIHQNLFAFWPIFVLGMALSYIYEKRGSLIAPITLHLFHNSIFIFYFFLAKEALGGK